MIEIFIKDIKIPIIESSYIDSLILKDGDHIHHLPLSEK